MSSPHLASLTVVHEPAGRHRPHALTFLASDGRGHVSHARLQVAVADWPRCLQSPPAEPQALRRFGVALAQAMLPAAVCQFLARLEGGGTAPGLMLHLSEALLAVPWELAVDDAASPQPLDERFCIQRHLLGAEPPEPAPAYRPADATLSVLCVPAPPAWAEPAPAALHWSCAATASWAETGAACDVLQLDAEASQAAAAGALQRLAGWPQRPRLLVAQGSGADADSAPGAPDALPAALAAEAAALGLALLWLPAGAQAVLPPFYRALASGAPLAQAAQAARAQARRAGQPGATAWLYGDGAQGLLRTPAVRPPDDDLRQITILSCDLVDSTRLMARLGDEAYSEGLTRYHQRVAETVGAHGGVSDDPQGDDGFMCYFGFPVASEDSAAQALRAALALSGALADLQWQLRIGVSTGRVVIRNGQPVGTAVHHAARLQGLAPPGGVLVADATRALVAERFNFELVDAAPQLKGFDDRSAIHRVLAEQRALGTERFDQRSRLSAFVGRDAELQAVLQRWEAARGGQRQTLLLAGEAGIGKSRLVREFRRALGPLRERALECRCAPEHTGSPLQPLIDLLQRRSGWHEADGPPSRLARVRGILAETGDDGEDEAVALLGQLLGMPRAQLPPLPAHGPERQRTLGLLLRWVQTQAADAPLCLIVEDVHWLDPSTREFIQRLIAGPSAVRLLLLLTVRGRADDAAVAAFEVPVLPLAGLPAEAAQALLRDTGRAAGLGDAQLHWLAERADGVPLFIEESARMVAALAGQGAAPAGGDLAALLRHAVPATLNDLLMARLDQLPTARRAAQLGSAIGRAFDHALIEAVNQHPDSPIQLPDLPHELALLAEAGLVVAGGGSGEPRRHVFKHALVRDAAYQSLLERDRRRLHGAIATVMQAQFQPLCVQQPELLAQHLELSGQDAPALAAWERAARHAVQRSAHDEAIAHLQRALAILARSPQDEPRDRTELRLQLLLASRLIATEGYGADRVEAVYGRALALGRALGDEASLTKARLGLEGWHFMRGNFRQAQAFADEVATSLGQAPEPLARMQSSWAHANIVFHQGDLPQAVALMDACLADYDRLGHRPGAVQDPGVMCLCYSSWALWEMGRADTALQRARRVVDLAEGLNHPFSIGEAHGFLAVAHYFRGEPAAGLAAARRAIAVCEAGGFAVWLAHAKVLHGRLRADAGDIDGGLAEMQQGYAMWAATGAVVTRPFYTVLRAEGLALAGRPDEGLLLLDEAHDLIQRFGERYYEPEVLRAIGVLTWRSPRRGGAAAAEPWLQQALAAAQAAGLAGLALRAATSLGQLRVAQGRPADAVALLQAALAAVPEGHGTRDRRDADALLADWRAAAAAANR